LNDRSGVVINPDVVACLNAPGGWRVLDTETWTARQSWPNRIIHMANPFTE